MFDQKLSKKGLLLLLALLSFSASGCFIFKKKCDCPKFSRYPVESQSKNG